MAKSPCERGHEITTSLCVLAAVPADEAHPAHISRYRRDRASTHSGLARAMESEVSMVCVFARIVGRADPAR